MSERVLIAEDETLIRLDLRQLLETAGFEVCAEVLQILLSNQVWIDVQIAA